MPKYRVRLKRVVYAEVVVEGSSAKDARAQVEEDPHEWFLSSQTFDQDTTTISSVKVEPE